MDSADLGIGTEFGKYRITALLGKGGMGEVYEAYDTQKHRTVALKILADDHARDDRFRARFLRESHAAAIVEDPHIVPIHDWGEIDGKHYIDMRLVRGETLDELARAQPLEPARAVGIIQQVAEALDAAHAQGLVHRDVKPHNIIVMPNDFAYLVDFGIAEASGETRLTMAGTKIGSFAYMAPERFSDEPSTPATDVYSLACVLYEALTGSIPFPANSYEHLIAAHVSAAPPRPSAANPRVPTAFDDVIARGMAKEPDDRYGSAGALGRAAQRALSGGGPDTGGISTSADTRAAPLIRPPGYPPPTYPAQDQPPRPAITLESNSGNPRSLAPLLMVGVTAAVLLGAVGMIIGLLMSKKGTDTAGPPAPPPPVTITVPTVIQTESPSPAPTRTVNRTQPPAATPGVDPEVQSLAQLRQIAENDRGFVRSQLADIWVPQLSSKRPGIFDEGVVWDNVRTLDEHVRLRQRYGARLLWSGDWSTFDAPNFWVTVAPVTFSTAEGALRWCTGEGFDPLHCYAKLVSTTHPIPGSTAHN